LGKTSLFKRKGEEVIEMSRLKEKRSKLMDLGPLYTFRKSMKSDHELPAATSWRITKRTRRDM
jgi:hypothetical protein